MVNLSCCTAHYTGLWVFPFSTMDALKNNAGNITDWKCLRQDQSACFDLCCLDCVGWQLGGWRERITEARGKPLWSCARLKW